MTPFSSWNTFKRVNQFSYFPFYRASVISEIIKLTLRFVRFRIYSHQPAHLCYLFWYPFVPKCVCFPQNCRVQTVLQTSYESWRFWLHRVVTVRGKQRKTDQEREESICFHPKPSRGSLMPAILGKTAATHTHRHTEQIQGMFWRPVRVQGVITDDYHAKIPPFKEVLRYVCFLYAMGHKLLSF